jgi:peptidoglycan/xylan/chitin deacetylase (PgdA/CDA1 family)
MTPAPAIYKAKDETMRELESEIKATNRRLLVTVIAVLVTFLIASLAFMRTVWAKSSCGCPLAAKTIIWTFDDGPSKNTPLILAELRRFGFKGIFFINGANLNTPANRAYLKQAAQEGHKVGNHLYSHHDPCRLSGPQVDFQLKRTRERIRFALCGNHGECTLFKNSYVKLYRPPFGNRCHLKRVLNKGYRLMLWDVSDIRLHVLQMAKKVAFSKKKRVIVLIHGNHRKLGLLITRYRLNVCNPNLQKAIMKRFKEYKRRMGKSH